MAESRIDESVRAAPALSFLLVAAGVTLTAMEGGAYDLVVRQEGALVLWWLLGLAALVGVLPRNRPQRAGAIAIGALAGLATWTALSLLWTSSAERTLVEVARVAAHLGVLLVVVTALDRRTWCAAIGGAAAAAALVCAYALATRLHPGFLGSDDRTHQLSGRRVSLPLNYWNAVGAWAGMTTALCLAWSAHARERWARGIALAAVPLSVVVAYLTYSRASVGGTVVGLLALVALSRNRWTVLAHAAIAGAAAGATILVVRGHEAIEQGTGSAGAGSVLLVLLAGSAVAFAAAAFGPSAGIDRVRLRPHAARTALLAGATIAVPVAIVAAVALGPKAWDSFTTPYRDTGPDPAARLGNLNGTRHFIYETAIDAARDHPLRGTGAGTFEFVWNRAAKDPESMRDGHSLYLETAGELGLPGLLLLLALLGGFVAAMARALQRPGDAVDRGALAAAGAGVAAYLFGAGVDWLWESTAVTVLALILMGAVIASAGGPAPRLRVSTRLGVAAACLLACALMLPGLVSTSEVRRSGTAVRAGDLASALEHASNAIDAQPWAATPYIQRGLVEERLGRYRAARGDLLLAQRRETENWRIPLLLARVEAESGAPARALADYRRARALRPLGAFFVSGTSVPGRKDP